MVRAYVADMRVGDAEELLTRADHFTGPAREPYRQRSEGAIALELGRTDEAIRLLAHASATFARAESKWEELWTSLVLARARAAAGQLDAAASELSTISAVAEGAGIALIVRMASEAHVALGLAGDRHQLPRRTEARRRRPLSPHVGGPPSPLLHPPRAPCSTSACGSGANARRSGSMARSSAPPMGSRSRSVLGV